MNNKLILAGLAAALAFSAPLAAQAAPNGRAEARSERHDNVVKIRDDRRDNRADRRDNRRDNRADRRDNRRDNRVERRQDRREYRQDLRQDRREYRQDRRQDRRVATHRGDRPYKAYRNAPYKRYYHSPVRTYRHGARHWNHWQPRLHARHYYGFGAPTYYGDHYRVYAYDRDDRLVWLWISAVTGAILFSGY